MSHPEANDTHLQDLMDSITQALLNGHDHLLDRLIQQASQSTAIIDDLVSVASVLRDELVSQHPSDKFTRQLKQDLIGEPDTFVARMRSVPGRVHIATVAAAIIAGLMWITRRRDGGQTSAPEPALQSQ